MLSPAMRELFRVAVRARLNLLIAGGTGAGKTTFMNALSREIPDGERLITIEDAAELQLQQPHVIRLETRAVSAEGTGQVTMRDLLVNTLRMRPDRIIVGEVRGGEANEMLQAMNTGHPGSMCTLHANNPRDALIRLENMLMSGSGDIPLPALRRQIAGSIDLVVQLARLRSGTPVRDERHQRRRDRERHRHHRGDVAAKAGRWRARLRDLRPAAVLDGGGGRGEPPRAAPRRPAGRPPDRGGRGLSPLALALVAAGGVALVLLAAAAAMLGWRRTRDRDLNRRIRRTAAPLAGPAPSESEADEESIFRPADKRTWFAGVREFIETRYPFLEARRALPVAVAAGAAGAAGGWFAMWFLKVPAGWWTAPVVALAGVAVGRNALG